MQQEAHPLTSAIINIFEIKREKPSSNDIVLLTQMSLSFYELTPLPQECF